MRFGKRCIAGLAGAALAMLEWSGPLHAQVSGPSAFSETYGNWTVRCAIEPVQEGEGVRRCVMEQRFIWRDDESGQSRPLLTITLAPSDTGMEAVVMTPFGLRFDSGLRLNVDDHEGTTLTFHTCLSDGCIARGALPKDLIRSLWSGAVLRVEAEPATGGEAFRLEGPLSGFNAAGKRLLGELGDR